MAQVLESLTVNSGQDDCKSIVSTSAIILKHFRQGCICSIESYSFVQLLKKGFEIIHNGQNQQKSFTSDERKALLSFLALVRTLIKSYFLLDAPDGLELSREASSTDGGQPGYICKRFHEWILLMVKLKFDFLSGLCNLWSGTSDDSHLRHLVESTFHLLLTCLPCPSRATCGDCCRKSCQKIVENFIQLRSKYPQLGTSLIYSMFCILDKDVEKINSRSPKKVASMACRTSPLRIKRYSRTHFHSLKQFAINELKQHWSAWLEQSFASDDKGDSYRLEILILWKNLVSITSNLGYSQSREFVASASKLVGNILVDSNHLIKQKELDILNEILCYGSTLSIQSTIPFEVSELAQALLRQAKTVSFDAFSIPVIQPGFGGNQFKPDAGSGGRDDDEDGNHLEPAPSLGVIQSLVLLQLKSSAIVVREAQCCSSSDSSNSDSSLSSHGSSSIGDVEQEMKLIERNVMFILIKLRTWIISQLELHQTSQLSQCITVLFNEQDDALIESLLCLLDIFTGLHNGINSLRHARNMTSVDCDVSTNVSTSTTTPLHEFLDPISAFDNFLQMISGDASVILDFLLSNETCFLLYFLRILKYMFKNDTLLNGHTEQATILQVLRKVHVSIRKLTQKSLFPYEISPVLKQLEKIVPLRS